MFIIHHTIARLLMEEKLREVEGRQARMGHKTGAIFRRNPVEPFSTVYRPSPPRSQGGL